MKKSLGAKEDKFSTSGLTPVKSDIVDAPYIKEFPFVLECRLLYRNRIAYAVYRGGA